MDENEKLRFLLEELLKQKLIWKNFNEREPGHLTIKKEILDQIINSSEYKDIRSKADMRSDQWASEYKTQIVAEERKLSKKIADEKTRKEEEINNTEMGRQAEIAEFKIKIIKTMIEKFVGNEIWQELDKLEKDEILNEYIEKKGSFDDPKKLP